MSMARTKRLAGILFPDIPIAMVHLIRQMRLTTRLTLGFTSRQRTMHHRVPNYPTSPTSTTSIGDPTAASTRLGSMSGRKRLQMRIPRSQKDGVEGVYTYTTEKYDGMNAYLRNIDTLTPEQSAILDAPSISEMTDAQRASWEAEIRKSDEGLAALPPYRAAPENLTSTTWRGIQASDHLLDQLKMGDTFSDPAYLSTSTKPHIGELFAGANPDTTPTLITVVGRDGVDVKDLSRYMDESEILFPRSTQFEVVSREMGDDGLLRITLRQKEP
jgi:hypothetical protein